MTQTWLDLKDHNFPVSAIAWLGALHPSDYGLADVLRDESNPSKVKVVSFS